MRRFMLSATLLLCACVTAGPVQVVYKPGSTGEQRLSALTDCQIEALGRVPRATATGVTPSYSTPSNVQCYGTGAYINCQEYGGQTYGGTVYSYDTNVELRDRATAQCLQQRGYQVVSLPSCNSEQSKRAVSSVGRTQPTVDLIECVVDGGFVLKQ